MLIDLTPVGTDRSILNENCASSNGGTSPAQTCQAGHVTTDDPDDLDSLRALTARIREFSTERDWEKFHDPKSLVLALVGEVGELAELFQWVPAHEAVSQFADPDRHRRAAEEISDVLVYLLRLADVLDVDVGPAANAKLADSARRFSPESFQGRAPEKR